MKTLFDPTSLAHQNALEQLRMLRARFKSARDDELLMHLLLEERKRLNWLRLKIVSGESVFPMDEMVKARSADHALALFDAWLERQVK